MLFSAPNPDCAFNRLCGWFLKVKGQHFLLPHAAHTSGYKSAAKHWLTTAGMHANLDCSLLLWVTTYMLIYPAVQDWLEKILHLHE